MKKSRPTQPLSTEDLINRLHSASSEMDSVIRKLRAAADERLKAVTTLESSIDDLSEKEKALNERIEGTEGISKATVEALAGIISQKLEAVERPKKRRDYALFAAGVIVSVILAIGIEATKPLWTRLLHLPAEFSAASDQRSTDKVLPHSATPLKTR